MMIKKIAGTALLVLVLVTFTFAADITGHWAGTLNNQIDVAYNFKVDGEKLTGQSIGPDGAATPISNGVIKGDDISFTANIMDSATKITGKIKGDSITLSFKTQENNEETIELKKEK